jgi:D-alanyl-D-alanine dipeptidase
MSFHIEKNTEIDPTAVESLPPIGYDRIIRYTDSELARIKPAYTQLLQARHDLYAMQDSQLSPAISVEDQLYPENSYNSQWTKPDLRLRKGGVEFHMEPEKLDDEPSDSPEYRQRKKAYRQSIIKAAQTLGGYLFPGDPGVSPNELDRHLGMRESILSAEKPITAETVIIPAAAAFSNHMRIQDTLRNLQSGALKTNQVIITTGERIVPGAERAKVEAKGYRSGDTEFEAAIRAFEDLSGTPIEEVPTKLLPSTYGTNTPETKYKSTRLSIGSASVEVIILEAGYDRERRNDETGRSVGRASTDETFYAALPFMDNGEGTVVIESHDVWIPYQEVIGNQVFGLYGNKEVIATGPYKDDRIVFDENGQLDMNLAQGAVDEIGKRHDDLVRLRLQAKNAKSPEIALLGTLVRPIPDSSAAYVRKQGYREHPIKPTPEFEQEPLVSIAEYGLAGQSYYSRPNVATGEGLGFVSKEILLRKSIAETLQVLNEKLNNPMITAFFDGEVELYIEEGVRTREVQKQVREHDYPALLRKNHPELSDVEIEKKINDLFAAPSQEGSSPSPHETGAAFDVTLRYKQENKGYVPGVAVDLGHEDGQTDDTITPDYFEHPHTLHTDTVRVRTIRRAFYNIMTGAAFNMTTGFVVNPTEFWHWSRHDQLASKVAGQPAALYGAANAVQ